MSELHERFDRLFDKEGRTRWRMIAVSAGAIALYGLISQVAGGAKATDIQQPATIIGIVVFTVQVLLYCSRPALSLRTRLRTKIYLLRSSIAIATSALLAVIAFISAPAVQAAILNRRLRAAMGSIVTTPETNFQEVRYVFSAALNSPARLPDNLVASATQAVSKQNTPSAWEAYTAILEYMVNLRSNEGTDDGLDWHIQRLEDVTKEAPLCGPQNSRINVAEFITKSGRVTHFNDVRSWPTAVEGCRLVLDGMSLKNTEISYAVIKYDGGPVTLDNVRLLFVKLELADNPNARSSQRNSCSLIATFSRSASIERSSFPVVSCGALLGNALNLCAFVR